MKEFDLDSTRIEETDAPGLEERLQPVDFLETVADAPVVRI